MTTQTVVLIWTATAFVGLAVFTILTLLTVDKALSGLFVAKKEARSPTSAPPPSPRREAFRMTSTADDEAG